jgi:hypothetical protein
MKTVVLFFLRIRAFVARDFRLAVSYRVEFFLRILSILIVVTSFYFVSRIFIGNGRSPFPQWQDPFISWITGLPILNYFMTGFSSLATLSAKNKSRAPWRASY